MFPAPSADRHGPNRMGDSRRTAEARHGPRPGCPTAVGLYAPLKPLAGAVELGLGLSRLLERVACQMRLLPKLCGVP